MCLAYSTHQGVEGDARVVGVNYRLAYTSGKVCIPVRKGMAGEVF